MVRPAKRLECQLRCGNLGNPQCLEIARDSFGPTKLARLMLQLLLQLCAAACLRRGGFLTRPLARGSAHHAGRGPRGHALELSETPSSFILKAFVPLGPGNAAGVDL